MAEQVYRYKAFISYRHREEDRRWAKWLVARLETFRTPRSLVRAGVPSRIGRLFRDDDEVPASNDLSHQIEESLTASQYLIVVCSPATPASKWVRKEIDFFRELGRGDRILALLIEGEPGESFPENLRHVPHERIMPDGSKLVELVDSEPIASDVRDRPGETRKELERRAFLRIAAGLLGCTYDDLFQRERQRQRHRQRIFGSAAAAAASVAAAAAYLSWDYYVPKVAYYREFGTRWGVPFGVGELTRDAVAHRGSSYEITSVRHRVVMMRRLGGAGSLRPLLGDGFFDESFYQGVAAWHIYYQDERVRTIVLGDAQDHPIRKQDYDFAADGRSATELNRNPKGSVGALQAGMFDIVTFAPGALQSKSQVASHQLQFSPAGLIVRRDFQTAFGQLADAGNGTFGRTYTYYSNGLIRTFRDIDEDGHTHLDAAGIAELFRRYDAAGDFVMAEWRDIAGRPTVNTYGYARWTARRDRYGNVTEVHFTDPRGRPALSNTLRAASFTAAVDQRGNETRESYFDTRGRPTTVPFGCSRRQWQYDNVGRAVVDECFGMRGEPVLNAIGYFRLTHRYDWRGFPVEDRHFGIDGKPIVPHGTGWAGLRRQFDQDGNLVSQSYFAVDARPLQTALGFASVRLTHLSRQNADLEAYFGVHGEPVARSGYGVARILRRYDQYGNVADETYFGVDGKRTLRADLGVSEIAAIYDDRGDVVEQHFLNQGGKPIADARLGVARIQRNYSKDGSSRSERYFDPDDRPCNRRDLRVAAITAHFDRHGNEVEEDYFGADGRRMARSDYGIAVLKRHFDAKGDLTEESYFDAAGQPAVRRDRGFARMVFRYDGRGNQAEEAYFREDGRPTNNLLGFSDVKRRYDLLGRKLEEAYFGMSGLRAVRADSDAARLVWHYDIAGKRRELLIYNAANQLRRTLRFDAQGRVVSKP